MTRAADALPINPMLIPDRFSEASVYDLLDAAAKGHVGLDRRWLNAILAHGNAAVGEIVRFGLEDRADDPVILDEPLIILLRHFRSPESLPFFIEYLRGNEEIPEELVPAVQAIGPPALDPLLQLYDDIEEDQAGDVAFCIAALRVADERALAVLTERLDYDLTEGAICLGLYGDPAAKPALERVLADEEDAHLKALLQDAIAQLGRGPDEDEPFDIQTYFEDRALPPSDILDEPDLLEMLQSADPDYRFAAAESFAQGEPSDDATEAVFQHAVSDEEPRVRAKCWEALAELSEHEEIRNAMIQRLQDESAPKIERAGALIGLGQVAAEQPVRRYAEEFYNDPETRAAALAAMWNSLDRSFASYFTAHLDDPDPVVRKQAISGVGYLGVHDAAERLRPMFDDEDYRNNALFAYAMCVRAEVSPSRMRSLLRKIEDLAGGLESDEKHLVELALDERLLLSGHKPIFHPTNHEHLHEPVAAPPKPGRNDPCPCGSGQKYKKCHGA